MADFCTKDQPYGLFASSQSELETLRRLVFQFRNQRDEAMSIIDRRDGVIRMLEIDVKQRQTTIDRQEETIKRQAEMMRSMSAPTPVIVPNERVFNACIEFAKTVNVAYDKLKMTRTRM